MVRHREIGCLAVMFLLAGLGTSRAAELGTHFTYQGRLVKNGSPIGSPSPVVCDMTFGLWDAATMGNQIGLSPIGPLTISVTGGLFNVNLSFGAEAINGQARWLEIRVQCPGDGSATTLTPRQQLRPAPHALALPGLYTLQDAFSPSLIGGRFDNVVTSGVSGATISGGGAPMPDINRVTDTFGTVGGGCTNRAGNDTGTTGDAQFATVAGGFRNTASGYLSTIGGGDQNTASGYAATVPGGQGNLAGGSWSLAAGLSARVRNAAQVGGGDPDGDEGTFVWGDTTEGIFPSTGPNQFLIRSSGGVGINTNAPTQALDVNGNFHASGTITSGSSINIDGTSNQINSDGNIEIHVANGRAIRIETNAASPNIIGGFSGNMVGAGVSGGTIAGGGQPGLPNKVMGNSGTVGGGQFNEANADLSTIGGGWANDAFGSASTVDGGLGNAADGSHTTIGGGHFNFAIGDFSTVGGGQSNGADGLFCTVSGGSANEAFSDNSTIGGGIANLALGVSSTISGGSGNQTTGNGATISGGLGNQASGASSSIAGGSNNSATGFGSAIGGGDFNVSNGIYSNVSGGLLNSAGGDYSFVSGRRAIVRDAATVGDSDGDQGTFVWADSTNADFTSDGPNKFLVRASGGTKFYSDSAATVGVELAAGGNSWSMLSDRNVKENFSTIDPREILQRLADMPITIWNLKSQISDIKHIGPMAQDFHAAFGLGESNTHISSSDADGVALAAIQGLHGIVTEKESEISDLRSRAVEKDCEIDDLREHLKDVNKKNTELEERVIKIEALLEKRDHQEKSNR